MQRAVNMIIEKNGGFSTPLDIVARRLQLKSPYGMSDVHVETPDERTTGFLN
jgi:hypothetical protein